jgi:hypothetical protein
MTTVEAKIPDRLDRAIDALVEQAGFPTTMKSCRKQSAGFWRPNGPN